MKNIAEQIASYANSIRYEAFPPEVVHRAKCLLIDTLGCAIGAYASEPAKIARRIAERVYQYDMPATIIGSGQKTSLELATFANGIMLRYLDFSDGFLSTEGGHPSDNFAPVLTCADAVHASGKEVITASILAYEVYGRLFDQVEITSKGFDQPVLGIISCVIGASKILGLSREQMVQAINLAVVPNMALAQTRVGELSMWKSVAMANAGRNAVFAALLAKDGMTGPSPIFEGRYGLFQAITGPFQLKEFGGDGRPFRIMDVSIKRYPCCQLGQTAVDAAIKLRSQITAVDEIKEVMIETFPFGKSVMAGDPEKWLPKTRETADHSFPYAVAIALMYGSLENRHYDDEYLHNPHLLSLMQKIKVEAKEELGKQYPGASPNRVKILTMSDKKLSEIVQYHRGHFRNPLTDEEVEQKFHSLTGELLLPRQRTELLSTIWNLEQVKDVSALMPFLQV